MLQNLTGWHFLIILVVILLLFGAPRLPALARSLGQSMRILKNEVKTDDQEDREAGATTPVPGDDASKSTSPGDSPTKS